ncbi:MAG TPA: glycosyltransferase family 2 protein [Pseudolabrys sp.]|nr:glycosyltransferase family 2 protein [Pseudolabrys sp.]
MKIYPAGHLSPFRFWNFRKRPCERRNAHGNIDLRKQPGGFAHTAAQRRAFALGASIEDVLKAAATRAAEQLNSTQPAFSAGTLRKLARVLPLLLGALAVVALSNAYGSFALCILAVLPAGFRLLIVGCGSWSAETQKNRAAIASDEDLPIYSIILPLRREARVVDQLLSGIERLDYPAAKLDVILVVEADEPETRAAITTRKHCVPVTVIPAPPTEPRTKPKALNIALEFARGEFTVIYDAEDRPDSNQLRRAVETFRSSSNDLACVQARLCIDTDTSWLARYFTAEYAGQFDIFLPNLAAFGLPLPLGGSSNHFRTATLREVGKWDAYNVTEDADLGMRLARYGYRCGVIDSTTYEEAPARAYDWLRQRSRWLKGWMQTWLVHMRSPIYLLRQLGLSGFLTFQLVVGGNALVTLVHPLFLINLIWDCIGGIPGGDFRLMHVLAAAGFGYFVSASLGFLGLWRRGMLNRAPILLLTPLYWLLLSAAGWWAAREIVSAPSRWNKTEHGLDGPPRLENLTSALLRLNTHITELMHRGEIPQIWIDATYNAANPRLRPRAAVSG